MIITGTSLIVGKLDISSLERIQEKNPIEAIPFRIAIKANQSIVADDKFYTLQNIQSALKAGLITISDYDQQDVFSQEVETAESLTPNFSLTKVNILNRADFPQSEFEKMNANMDIIDANLGGGGGGTTDHAALTNLDYASSGHTGFLPSSHLSDFNHSSINHTNRTALDAVSGVNTGDQDLSPYNSHMNDTSIHFLANTISHNVLQDIGTNSHAQIDLDLQRLANTSGTNTGDQNLSNYLQNGDNVSSLANDAGYVTASNVSSSFLKLDQTTPQSVVNGAPTFDAIKFNTGATPLTNAEGLLQWNSTDGTLDLGMSGGDIAQQIGQELFVKVHNRSGTLIPNGTPVYIHGRQGNRPKIWLAKADIDFTSIVVGITTQDIPNQADGYVTTFGYVRQIKTNYSGTGDWGTTWNEGDDLYVSKTVAGQLTNVEPDSPHHSDIVGHIAIVGGAGVGSIFVNIIKHKTLSELSDVDGTPLTTDGQLVVWSNTNSVFDFNYNINDYLEAADAANTYTTVIDFNAHADDTSIHFAESSIDHNNIQNIGTNSHAQIDIDLARLSNTSGENTGDQDLSNYLQNGDNVSSLVNDAGYLTSANVSGAFLKLDQTTPQSITNGAPIFDAIQINTGATPLTNAEGLLQWNSTDGTLDLGMSGGDITQQIGQELFIKVHNRSGTTIPNGTPVYADGRQGNRPKIWLAKADSDSTATVIGLTTQDIDDHSDGFITTFGYVRQIKTNYSGSGDWGTTWNEGDDLYVSKTVAGQLTNVEPSTPHHSDIVGRVAIVGGSGIGSIFVNISRHKTLEELSDVDGTPLTTDGQLVVWSNTASVFDFNYNINNYLSTSNAASTYAKIDGTNQPFTGNVTVSKSNPKLIVSDTGLSSSAYLEKQTASDGARLVSQNRLFLAGTGLSLNGSGYATRSAVSLGSVHSYEFWMKTSTAMSDCHVIGSPTYNHPFQINDSSTRISVWTNSGYTIVHWYLTSFADGLWHHWVVTRNGTTVVLYKDGVSQGTQIATSSGNTSFANIGAGPAGTLRITAVLDEVVFWDKVLTPSEVLARYNSGQGTELSSYTNVVAEYRFNSTYNDSSPNAHHLSAAGSGNAYVTGQVQSAVSALTDVELAKIQNNATNLSYGNYTHGYYSTVYGTSNYYEGLSHQFNVLGTSRLALSGSTLAMTGAITASTSIGASTTLSAGTTVSAGTLFLGGAGTAAGPTYSFTGNAAMGLYSGGTNLLNIATAGAARAQFDASGRLKIGTGAIATTQANALALLDVSGAALTMLLGSDDSVTTRTNATTKVLRVGGYHYTNAEEPYSLFVGYSNATTNGLDIGGGTSSLNASTLIRFLTAANQTTLTGTVRMQIDSAGAITISDTSNFIFNTATGTKFGTATNQKISFWNATPIIQPVTNAYSSDSESVAYTGIDNAQAGTVYAQVSDLNTLRVAYDNLRASYDDLLSKLKTTGIVA